MAKKKVFDPNSPEGVLAAVQFGEVSHKRKAPKMSAKKKSLSGPKNAFTHSTHSAHVMESVYTAGVSVSLNMDYNASSSGNTPEAVVRAAFGDGEKEGKNQHLDTGPAEAAGRRLSKARIKSAPKMSAKRKCKSPSR